ncbi:MAG TPA: hypothetical protein VGZ72_08550 [Stellaceae bacterium]|nr:hypothetical protein [Stellaceae bacterium]
MSAPDLAAELCAAQGALSAEHRARLRGLGIPDLTLAIGFVGVARIDLDRSGRRYQPAEAGDEVFLTPARIGNPVSPEDPDFELIAQYGELIDLVAWLPDYPDRWATRRGLATWLGAISPQLVLPPAVPIRRSVLAWLRAGATGLCLIPEKPGEAERALSFCQAIEAEDPAHAGELRRLLERPFKGPLVTVRAA